ncbi:MAG TPA: MFS transporter [Vicinamibacterales bacterium]|jgi:MFS family permease|nr:MFS transporter [Vicinamibacterales bacterium]
MPRSGIDRDVAVIFSAAFVRSSTVGLVGLVLAIYLAQAGFSLTAIGAIVGVGMAGAAVATLIAGFRGDVFGRRRTMAALAVLTAAGYASVCMADRALVLVPVAFITMLNGMGRDRGAASAIEQALLTAVTDDRSRTWLFAWYNVVLDGGHAFGALAGAVPILFVRWLHVDSLRAHRLTFLACAAAMAISAASYTRLSTRIELAAEPHHDRRPRLSPQATRAVTRLAMLFGIDSLGGGFLSSTLIAYWFFERFGASEATLAGLFFSARVLNAVGHLAAAWIARRIGLVNTMVLTHLPSSLFIMAAPLAPTATIAGLLFLCREALVEMDVPTRQSYVMAIMAPGERSAASGVTNVTRSVGWAAGPSMAGFVMQHALAAPLLIGGTLKIAYDILLYASFRRVVPPEERAPEGPG